MIGTTRTRRSTPDLVVDVAERRLYVKLRASGIAPMFALADRLPLVCFGEDNTPYLRVETALEWYERELRIEICNKHYQQYVAVFQKILERHEAGERNL